MAEAKQNVKTFSRIPILDFFRGLSLLFIFVDHISLGKFSRLTLQNLGLSDGAEMFVFISGVVSGIVYTKILNTQGFAFAFQKSLRRIRTLYFSNILLLVFHVAIAYFFHYAYGLPIVNEAEPAMAPLFLLQFQAIAQFIFLGYEPYLYSILPIYMCFLLFLIPYLKLLERFGLFALIPSMVLYTIVHLTPGFNLGSSAVGWGFNPFAWQLLFFVGVSSREFVKIIEKITISNAVKWALIFCGFILPLGYRLLVFLSIKYPEFLPHALAHIPHPRVDWLHWKQFLALPRLAHFFTLVMIAYCFKSDLEKFMNYSAAKFLMKLGSNSLPVFIVSCLLDIVVNSLFQYYDYSLNKELFLIIVGLLIMLFAAHASSRISYITFQRLSNGKGLSR